MLTCISLSIGKERPTAWAPKYIDADSRPISMSIVLAEISVPSAYVTVISFCFLYASRSNSTPSSIKGAKSSSVLGGNSKFVLTIAEYSQSLSFKKVGPVLG